VATDRKARVAEAIKAELGDLIAREVKDPRVREGLVTISHVEVNRDLAVAQIGVSVLAGDPKAVLTGLERAARFLRGPLARRLGLRAAPELRFHHDQSQELAARVERIVREDQKRRQEAEPPLEPAPPSEPASESESGSESASGSESESGSDRTP
jgi:ribosome-binding factor A